MSIYFKRTRGGFAIFEFDGANYTLRSGSYLEEVKPSLRSGVFMQRAVLTANNTLNNTTADFSTPSLSVIASLVRGSNTGGSEFLTTCKEITKEEAEKLLKGVITTPSTTTTIIKPRTTTTTTTTTSTSTTTSASTTTTPPSEAVIKKLCKLVADVDTKLHDLLKELNFNPDGTELVNDRVLNNFYNTTTLQEAKNCFVDFMLLTFAPSDYIKHAEELFKSAEFEKLFNDKEHLKEYIEFEQMNKRLEIYFGGAGTGKTTTALNTHEGAHKIIASGTKDAETLFTFFNPKDTTFKESALARAMEEGKPIVIDEILLYNDEVLTRLQGITDNSPEFMDELLDKNITIKDGFKIIATMNLTRALPSALVSRAILKNFDRDFRPSAEQRASWQIKSFKVKSVSEIK